MVSYAPFCHPFNSEHLKAGDGTAERASKLQHFPHCCVINFCACFFNSILVLYNVLNKYGPDIRDLNFPSAGSMRFLGCHKHPIISKV